MIKLYDTPNAKNSYEPKTTMNNEAKSSETVPRFQDIPVGFTAALAEVFSLGHAKYETDLPPGVKNYQKGDARFFLARLDHAYAHLEKVKARCLGLPVTGSEDDLMHAVANLAMLFWALGRGVLPAVAHEVLPATARAEDRDLPTFTFLRRRPRSAAEPDGVAIIKIRWPSGSHAIWRASRKDVAALISEYGSCDGLDAALKSFGQLNCETDTTPRP